MTPKQIVKAVFPKAFCEGCGEVDQIVNPKQYGDVKVLGQSRNPKRAWEVALFNIRKIGR